MGHCADCLDVFLNFYFILKMECTRRCINMDSQNTWQRKTHQPSIKQTDVLIDLTRQHPQETELKVNRLSRRPLERCILPLTDFNVSPVIVANCVKQLTQPIVVIALYPDHRPSAQPSLALISRYHRRLCIRQYHPGTKASTEQRLEISIRINYSKYRPK